MTKPMLSQSRPWGIYTRVSTEEQAVSGASLEAQERACRTRLESEGLAVADVYCDAGFSAKSLKRPQLIRLLADAEAGRIGGIIVWKLDRFSRTVIDFLSTAERLTSLDVGLISVQERLDTSGPGGRFMITMLMSLAQLEREQTSERVKHVIRHKRSLGEFTGGAVPAGMRSVGAVGHRILEVDPAHGASVTACWSLVIGGATLLQVADHLQVAGVPTLRGKPWTKAQVSRLLAKRAYIGHLIDQKTFDRCRDVLDKRYAPTFGRQAKDRTRCHPDAEREWLLQGIARCARCGSALVGSRHGDKGHRYLRCTGRQKKGVAFCNMPNIPAKTYEELVINALRHEVQNGHELAQAITDLLVQRRMAAQPELRRRGALQMERDDLKQRNEEVLDLYEEGRLQKSAASERLENNQRRINEVDVQLAGLDGLASALANGQFNSDVVMASLRGAMGHLDIALPEQQRSILLGLVEEVRIDRGHEVVLTLALPEALKMRNPPVKPVGTQVTSGDLDGT